MDTQTENADETLPSATECADAVAKLMLTFFFYVRHGSGVRDEDGTPIPEKAKRTGNAIRKVIEDIDKLWAYGEDLRRDTVLVPRFLPLVIELERKAASTGPIEQDDPDLEYIDEHWEKMTGHRLTQGQRKILIGDLDDETRRKYQGPAERGRFRVAKLLGLKSARQVHKIEKGSSANAPHFWGHEPPFGEPFPEIAQYFATLYFFEEVLGWPFSQAVGRLARVSVTAERILAQGRARSPQSNRRDPQKRPQ